MTHRVVFSPEALSNLKDIRVYIRDEATARIASRFTNDLRKFILDLETFPSRGVLRDDIYPGLRVIGFRKRVGVHFLVQNETVVIVALSYAGRNWSIDYDDPTAHNE